MKTTKRVSGPFHVCAILLLLAASQAAAERVTVDRGVVRDSLEAVGVVEAPELERQEAAIQALAGSIVDRMGPGQPTRPRARKLHRMLHKDYLRRYTATADSMYEITESGQYNCLSASLFYGLVARSLGFDVQLLEYPGHVLLQLEINDRAVVVEATLKGGFDLHQHAYFDPSAAPANEGYLVAPSPRRRSEGASYAEFTLESSVGFAWLNRAWRALHVGEPVQAAEAVFAARRHLPEFENIEGIRRLLGKAFSAVYERGAFEEAYRIAAIDVMLFPDVTTSRDRLLAAALKRIEDLCDLDQPAVADALLNEVEELMIGGRDYVRLERRTLPIIAATAVRQGDWDLARYAAAGYAEAEPDTREADRLTSWVESRWSGGTDAFAGR